VKAAGPRYLRVSLTARCNLNCLYCRAGSERRGGRDELTAEQLRFIVECAAAEGVRKVRLTGGEPLQRADLEQILAALSPVPGVEETVMTTNGVGLAGRLAALKRAGLDRVNISLDSLRPERFARIAGADRHAEVMAAVAAACGTLPVVKINTVLLKGHNDEEVGDFVRFAARTRARVRFIEHYGPREGPGGGPGVPPDAVRRRIEGEFGEMVPVPGDPLSVEESYVVPGAGDAPVGLVRSASAPPCERCSKLRLTADGRLLGCLFGTSGTCIRTHVDRQDAGALREAVRATYRAKSRRGPQGQVVQCVRAIGG